MADYPEWLMKFKTKGVYAKKVKSGYALYRGHSERVDSKKYPVFKCDEYLGIATENGLIPPSPPVRPGIKIHRYGFYCMCEKVCTNLRLAADKKHLDSRLLYTHCLLQAEGKDTADGYTGSWLSVKYPSLDMSRSLTAKETQALERMKLQMRSKLTYGYKDDYERMKALSDNLYAVFVNGGWHLSDIPEELKELAGKYKIDYTIKTPSKKDTK